MSSQSLLGNDSTWNLKMIVGTILGTCLATVLVASTSTSLYSTATQTAQTTTVVAPSVGFAAAQVGRSSIAALPASSGLNVVASSGQASEATWAPLAAVTAIPLAVLAAITAFRTSRKQAIVDPIDMLHTSGSRWAMMASAGEYAVAKNYASALIELGQEEQCLEQLHSDVENFSALMVEEDFADFFNNPLVDADKQKEIISQLCDESQMSQITKNFLCFLVDRKRFTTLPSIIKEFNEQFYDATNTQVATVTAAVPLSEDELRMIANKLHEVTKGKNIKIKSEVNEELLAGFILEYGKSGSQRIDLSLKGQLDELKEELQVGIREILSGGGVPVAVQLTITALGINAILAGEARADSGNIFDFGLTMPIQMFQILLLMLFLDKVVFGPVGKVIDERAAFIRQKVSQGSDSSKEIAALNAQAEALLAAARRDAAKQLEDAKKEAARKGAERMAQAKAELDASFKRSIAELEKSKAELWAKLEEEVLPLLTEDILNKLLEEEETAEATAAEATA